MWPIMHSSFPPTPRVKTRGLNISKTSCDSSTHFAYFNSWQKVDRETSVVKFGHHLRAHLEGLTKFWGLGGSSAPLYSPFCTLKTCTFDLIPLPNPNHPIRVLTDTSHFVPFITANGFTSMKFIWSSFLISLIAAVARCQSHNQSQLSY